MRRFIRFALPFAALVLAAVYGLTGTASAAPAPRASVAAPAAMVPPATVAGARSLVGPAGLRPALASVSSAAAAATPPALSTAPSLVSPTTGSSSDSGNASVNVNLGNAISSPSQSITLIIALTLLSVAPTLLIMLTSFTRIIIVLSLTRQALGLNTVPPNQVLAGLALFLSLFIMAPTISSINKTAIQPYLHHQLTPSQAYDKAQIPLRAWMLKQTRTSDLAIFINESGHKPVSPAKVSMAALVPAFILSELKTAMIIGFVIFIPFLVIDLIVSSSLMSMGMMMLPPVTVSLPFKILLFVMVDGWGLVVKSLLSSFHT